MSAFPGPPRFAWYDRLSVARKRIYRQSDAILEVPLHDAAAIRPLVPALRAALDIGEQVRVQPAARKLMAALVADLEVPPVTLEILEVRPRDHRSELHGLYTWEPPRRPLVQVWMRTAVNERIVAFKSFLRTILHELGHHLDYHRFALEDSLHTRGFYARESSLCGQILGEEGEEAAPPRRAEQLRLPGFDDAVTTAIEALRARGLESPYLRAFVVARINPLRFQRGASAPYEATIDTMLAAAKAFDAATVRPDHLAKAAGPPPTEE